MFFPEIWIMINSVFFFDRTLEQARASTMLLIFLWEMALMMNPMKVYSNQWVHSLTFKVYFTIIIHFDAFKVLVLERWVLYVCFVLERWVSQSGSIFSTLSGYYQSDGDVPAQCYCVTVWSRFTYRRSSWLF